MDANRPIDEVINLELTKNTSLNEKFLPTHINQLSEYEKIREQNIKEIKEEMETTLGEISCLKQDFHQSETKSKKSLKITRYAHSLNKATLRRSTRIRKEVCYKDLDKPYGLLDFELKKLSRNRAKVKPLKNISTKEFEGMYKLRDVIAIKTSVQNQKWTTTNTTLKSQISVNSSLR